MRGNAFCMVFHVRWISHHSSPNPTLVASDSGRIRRLVVRKIHLTWKTIQNAYHAQGCAIRGASSGHKLHCCNWQCQFSLPPIIQKDRTLYWLYHPLMTPNGPIYAVIHFKVPAGLIQCQYDPMYYTMIHFRFTREPLISTSILFLISNNIHNNYNAPMFHKFDLHKTRDARQWNVGASGLFCAHCLG